MGADLQAILQYLMSGGYQPMPEYSSSKGYMPFDSGTLGANINQLQDVAGLSGQGLAANPLVLAALGMTQGDMFGMQQSMTSEGNTDGRLMLENVVNGAYGTGVPTWEARLAQALLDGESPSQALKTVENWYKQRDENNADQQAVTGVSWENLVESASERAAGWFDTLMKDSDPVYEDKAGAGLQVLRDNGIPDPGTEWSDSELNPDFEPARQTFLDAQSRRKAADAKVGVKKQDVRVLRGDPMGRTASAQGFGRGAAPEGDSSGMMSVLPGGSSAADLKSRRDAIAATDQSRYDVIRKAAEAEAMRRRLASAGVTPTSFAAQQRLGALQQFAGGGF